MKYGISTAKVREAPGGAPMPFTLSAPRMARDGITLDLSKMRLDNFRANPALLWSHGKEPIRGSLPIGRWHNGRLRDGDLGGEAECDQQDAFAVDVESKYKRGMLNAVSISWIDEGDSYDLLEVSAVAVPADPEALKGARSYLWSPEKNQVIRNPHRKTPEPTDRMQSMGWAAITRALLANIEAFSLSLRMTPGQARRYQGVDAAYRRFLAQADALDDDAALARKTVYELKQAHTALQEEILRYTADVPRLGDQVRDYIAHGGLRFDVLNHKGGMA